VDTPIIGFIAFESDHLQTTSDELIDGMLHVLHREIQNRVREWLVVGLGIQQDRLISGEVEPQGSMLVSCRRY